MSSPKIDYRGYEIRFGENSGTWRCWEFDAEDMDIAKVKAAIDRQLLKIRKGAGVDAILLTGYDSVRGVPVKIIEYLGPVTERSGQFGTGERVVVNHNVAVTGVFSGNDKPSRRKELLSSLAVPCEFTAETLAKIKANHERIEALKKVNNSLSKEIGRIRIEDIETLQKVAVGDLPDGAE